MEFINCSILLIGTELLTGKITDLNAQFVIKTLKNTNINITDILTINDNPTHICNSLHFLSSNSNIIIISGGLGPTNDDITKIGISEFLNQELIYDENLFNSLKKNNRFLKKYINKNYAILPQNCSTLTNEVGLAPGIVCKFDNKKIIYALPGISSEFKIMFEKYVINHIYKHFLVQKKQNFVIRTSNIGESSLENIIKKLLQKYNIEKQNIGYYPNPYGVDIIIYDYIDKQLLKELQLNLKQYIYGINTNLTLPEILKQIFIKEKLTLAVAESCTGGFLSKIITDIPGASSFFKGGIISYSNELKTKLLNVKPQILETFGAVSAQTVEQMLQGILKLTNADYGIAISGIAGPSGGTLEKPVGTVYIAYGNKNYFKVKKIFGGKYRDTIRQKSAYNAIFKLLKMIKGDFINEYD